MNDSDSQQPNQLNSPNEGGCETENMRAIYVFVDAVGDNTVRPARPVILDWIRQHQYLLQPPKQEKDEQPE